MHKDLVGLLPMLAEGFNLMFHLLVGSCSAQKTWRRSPAHLRRGVHRWLGFPIWRAGDNKTRLLPSVFFCGLGHPLLLPGYPLHHHSSLPLPGQWDDLVSPQAAQDALRSCLALACRPQHLPWVLLGLHAAPKKMTKYLGRASLWVSSDPSWPVPGHP
jgi:hypothetical protein